MIDRIIRGKDKDYMRDSKFLTYYRACAKESLKKKDMKLYKSYMKIIKEIEDKN